MKNSPVSHGNQNWGICCDNNNHTINMAGVAQIKKMGLIIHVNNYKMYSAYFNYEKLAIYFA